MNNTRKKGKRGVQRCTRWGRYVAEIRVRRGLTRYQLADLADIDSSYVTVIERDGYIPSREVVKSMAKALGVDVDFFSGQAGYATPAVFNAYLKSLGLKPVATVTSIRKNEKPVAARKPRELVAANG